MWDDIDLFDLAKMAGSPLYVYNMKVIERQVELVRQTVPAGIDVYYAVKANPKQEILAQMRQLVDGVDISSAGEYDRTVAVGYNKRKMSFAGPAKTDDELRKVISGGICFISVESVGELKRVNSIANKLGKKADIAVRVNPVEQNKGYGIRMGGRASQFGVDEEALGYFFKVMAGCKHISWHGIHVYAGTQCLDSSALIDGFKDTLEIASSIRKMCKLRPKVINFGGGFGLPYYEKQTELDLALIRNGYQNAWRRYKKENRGEIRGIIELGRFLVGGAGVYIARVVDVKKSRGRWYGTLDGGMNHHLPASGNFGQVIRRNYQALNLVRSKNDREKEMTLVGPICSTIDVMSDKVMMRAPKVGDFIAYLYSGAYGLTASPIRFLSHDLPKEVLIDKGEAIVL